MSAMFSTLKAGLQYSRDWPLAPELNAIFPENKVIRATVFAQKTLPAVAVAGALVQFNQLGATQLPLILTMMLFILSMPFQGWYWLGKRAKTELPPTLSGWYSEIKQKMQSQGLQIQSPQHKLRYSDLALLLKQAFGQLDKTFLRDWL
jgi:uncharacterized membrane protein YfbV (UPF0208 family)